MDSHSGSVADAGPSQTVMVNEIVHFDGNKSCSPDGAIITYEWDFGDGLPNGTGMYTTHIYNTQGTYNVTLTVSDSKGNYDDDICIITVISPPPPAPPKPVIILKQGMNLISIPTIQSTSFIEEILLPLEGKYESVKWYHASDNCDAWDSYNIHKPVSMNDLQNLDHKMGFWIQITQPGDTIFIYKGTQPVENQTNQLYSGWNMVGYPSLTNYNRTAGLNNLAFGTEVDAIQWFDSSTKTWHFLDEGDTFEIGRGYWIHATTDCVWEVPL
jgi:hypothetical protein